VNCIIATEKIPGTFAFDVPSAHLTEMSIILSNYLSLLLAVTLIIDCWHTRIISRLSFDIWLMAGCHRACWVLVLTIFGHSCHCMWRWADQSEACGLQQPCDPLHPHRKFDHPFVQVRFSIRCFIKSKGNLLQLPQWLISVKPRYCFANAANNTCRNIMLLMRELFERVLF